MREIKFRGLRKAKNMVGVWEVGNYHKGAFSGGSFINGWEAIPETVGQFTGLTDKNGVEIYEGDIVKDKFDGGYTVDYCDDWGAFRAKIIYDYDDGGEKRFFIAGSQSFIGNAWREWEVIGNIHDNPELLEGTI